MLAGHALHPLLICVVCYSDGIFSSEEIGYKVYNKHRNMVSKYRKAQKLAQHGGVQMGQHQKQKTPPNKLPTNLRPKLIKRRLSEGASDEVQQIAKRLGSTDPFTFVDLSTKGSDNMEEEEEEHAGNQVII